MSLSKTRDACTRNETLSVERKKFAVSRQTLNDSSLEYWERGLVTVVQKIISFVLKPNQLCLPKCADFCKKQKKTGDNAAFHTYINILPKNFFLVKKF